MSNDLGKIMIYGCYGYSGALIAREALARGIQPILAGRNEAAVGKVADAMNCQAKVFDLSDISTVADNIKDVDVVIHAAGPFSATAKPMMRACIAAKVNYVDITGEMEVFAYAKSLDKQFKAAGIVAIPGVGFDVIPTDCVAAKLKELMPDATHLTLGFDSRSGMSKGTAKTSLESVAEGGRVRVDGELKKVPHVYKTRTIDFGAGAKHAMTIPWGDINTAYYSTGIQNIEVYIPISPKGAKRMQWLNRVPTLLSSSLAQNFIKKRIDKKLQPPSDKRRENTPSFVWGEATNRHNEKVTVRIKTANGYTVTKDGALTVAQKILRQRGAGVSGYMTPAMLAGSGLILELPGSGEFEIS